MLVMLVKSVPEVPISGAALFDLVFLALLLWALHRCWTAIQMRRQVGYPLGPGPMLFVIGLVYVTMFLGFLWQDW